MGTESILKRTVWWTCLLLFLSSCTLLVGPPLPTRASQALAPEIPSPRSQGTVPATYTAIAAALPVTKLDETDPPTLDPTPSLRPTVTASPSTTPVVLPVVQLRESSAPFLDHPPTMIDCGDQGFVFRSRFPSDFGGPWRTYHAYLPPCYGRDGRVYPVAYLIHGSIQTDSHWLDLGLSAYADQGIRSGRYPPFIAIMPFSGRLGNMTSGGDKSIEGITLNDLLPFINRTYCAWSDSAGRSIGGISRGGYWALEIAFSHPELFSAVAGHSSHLRFETDPARYNPLATYLEADLSDLRIWLDRGETDFLRAGQDQLHDALEAAGIPHDYRINPGGHSDAYWAAHLSEYLDWHAAGWPKERELYPICG